MLLGINVDSLSPVDDFPLGHHDKALADAAHQIQMLFNHQDTGAGSTDFIEDPRQVIDQHGR